MLEIISSRLLASKIRIHALRMVHQANSSHIGSCLSCADILAVLHTDILHVNPRHPQCAERDRLIFSKGHAAAALYAVLAEQGFFPLAELKTYCQNGARLTGHASHHVPGVEVSVGSLGHGLPLGCGKALAAKRQGASWSVFVVISDGELDEGSNWEAILFAPHHRLDNLIVVVDYNKIQSLGVVSETLELEPLAEKFRGFRWAVREIDGHDHNAIRNALQSVPWEPGKPSCLIAHTIKGKGVSFMENKLLWHYKAPDVAQLEEALRQIGSDT